MLLALHFAHPLHRLDVAAVRSSGSPSAPRRQAASTLAPRGVTGNAPWALSALPECFEQVLAARGSLAYVRSLLPPGAESVDGDALLLTADCRLEIRPPIAIVARGGEHLIVPATTRFYRWPDRIGFVRATPHGSELRLYRLHDRSNVVLAPLQ